MTTLGLDLLGMAAKGFPIDAVINHVPQGWAIGFFADVFGDAIPALKKIVQAGRFSAVRVQMDYNGEHKLVDIDMLKKRLPQFERIAVRHPEMKFYMSHSCEYKATNLSDIVLRINLIKKLAPSFIPVNNPWIGPYTKEDILESHDITKKGECNIVSTDGTCITQADAAGYVNRFASTDICFLWANRFNLRTQDPDLPPPLKRTAVPDADYIKGVVRLGLPKGIAPKPKFKGTVIPCDSKILYKPFSEDKGIGDIRANKPLLISPSDSVYLDVVDMNGKVISKLKYYGPYVVKGYYRHYSGTTGRALWGYQIGNRALRSSGSEFVWFQDRDAKVYYGPVNPAFREGSFRTGE